MVWWVARNGNHVETAGCILPLLMVLQKALCSQQDFFLFGWSDAFQGAAVIAVNPIANLNENQGLLGVEQNQIKLAVTTMPVACDQLQPLLAQVGGGPLFSLLPTLTTQGSTSSCPWLYCAQPVVRLILFCGPSCILPVRPSVLVLGMACNSCNWVASW